ncbi:MAG: ATP-dependent zinc metalloprotease FtsH [Tenericutes bacterium ADurb.Bin239]|nr:MAG: ATP-dependent zinc metalloprotease FtsH [Tenericutes bacterium ADurb.Bin239]
MFAKAIASAVKRKFIEVNFTNVEDSDTHSILKNKFKEAQTNSPAILFIDEIDKLVPMEMSDSPFFSDYSRSTLQLLLSLLDGFGSNPEVLVVCTTNTLHQMPEALTRAGRIDKHINLPLPDDESRKAIAEYYLNKVLFNKTIDIDQFVLSSEGLSGADIKTVINEAGIEAVSKKYESISTKLLIEHISRIEGKSLVKTSNDQDSEIIAYHELGHFVVANELKKIIKDININATNTQLGRVRYKLPSGIVTTEDLLDDVVIALGGRAAETVFLNKKYVGSWQDIQKSFTLLEQSVTYGDHGFDHLGFNRITDRMYEEIHAKVVSIMEDSLQKAIQIVSKNKEIIMGLHPKLLAAKTLTAADLKAYFEGTIVEAEEDDEYRLAYDSLRDEYIEM